MRIQPVIGRYSNVKKTNNQTRFESNNTAFAHRGVHRYSGNCSADLAYASIVDANIARDLRLMGLI